MKVNPHNLVFDNIRDMQNIERDPDFIDLVASLEDRVGQEMAPLSEIPTVYRMKDGKFCVKSGHRRVAACRYLGLTEINVFEVDPPASRGMLIIDQLTDSDHRKDISPLDRAKAIKELMALEGLNQKQAAGRLPGTGESLISQLLSLLELHPKLQKAIREGKSHWRALYLAHNLSIEDQAAWADSLIHSARTEQTVRAAAKSIKTTLRNLEKIRQLGLVDEKQDPDPEPLPASEPTQKEQAADAHAHQRLAELQMQTAQEVAEHAQIRLPHRLVKVSNDLLDEIVAHLSEEKSPQDIVLAAMKTYLKSLEDK